MTRYSVELGGNLKTDYQQIAEKRETTVSEQLRNALAFYIWVDRELHGAEIECEPNLPWKLSITKDENGKRVIVKNIELP